SVVSIEEWGEEMTYDIEVEGEPHNFVANGFVVHNTGKSLSANYIAKVAEEHGFTFIYAKAQDVPYAIDFARSYLPAVVFAEDIDMVATAERTEDVGKLLNKLDGIDTKRQDIIFVATTNHPDSINAALLRPGRIDLVMLVEPPDAEAAIRVARWYASGEGESSLGGMEDGDEHFREAGVLLAGMIPATIQEVVRRAQVRAFARTNGESSTISNQDLVNAAQYVKREQQLTNPIDIKSDPVKKLGDAFGQGLGVGIGKVLRMALPPQQAQIIQGTLPLELQEPAGVAGVSNANHQDDDEGDEE
ncbi:MAG TPA: AAA family ATPase, partial [Candidatus Paceibacterota bacterium]